MSAPAWKQRQIEAEAQRKHEIEEETARKAALASGQHSTTSTHKDFSAQLNEEAYIAIAQIIHQFGKPNNKYPKDLDITYAQLLAIAEHGGIGNTKAVLGTMKKQKRVDYVDVFLNDTSIITLVEDYNQDIKSELVAYADIAKLADKEKTSHQNVAGW